MYGSQNLENRKEGPYSSKQSMTCTLCLGSRVLMSALLHYVAFTFLIKSSSEYSRECDARTAYVKLTLTISQRICTGTLLGSLLSKGSSSASNWCDIVLLSHASRCSIYSAQFSTTTEHCIYQATPSKRWRTRSQGPEALKQDPSWRFQSKR